VLKNALRVTHLRTNAEAPREFLPPFLPQHGGTQHEKSPELEATAELSPDEAGLDCLSQPNLISDKYALTHRIQKHETRLDLVGVEVRLGSVEAIEDIREAAAQASVGEYSPQVRRVREPAFPKELDGIKRNICELKLVLGDVGETVREVDLAMHDAKLGASLAGKSPKPPWIIPKTNCAAWIEFHRTRDHFLMP
jgi:hypothetical protein